MGAVIRRFVESNDGDGPMLLENLIPPSCTGKDTAARTFACLLSLATGGGLQVGGWWFWRVFVEYGCVSELKRDACFGKRGS